MNDYIDQDALLEGRRTYGMMRISMRIAGFGTYAYDAQQREALNPALSALLSLGDKLDLIRLYTVHMYCKFKHGEYVDVFVIFIRKQPTGDIRAKYLIRSQQMFTLCRFTQHSTAGGGARK